MKRYYLGSFPPPYGGVTIKNRLIYSSVKKYLDYEIVNFSEIKNKNIRELLKFTSSILCRNASFIIGVSGDSTRKKFTKLLYIINRKSMRNSIIMIMGGVAHNTIASDKDYRICMKEYKMIYVETSSMMRTLNDAGLDNVKVFPNCRENPNISEIKKISNSTLHCVFFSRISKEKGVDLIIEACKKLDENGINYTVDFYGKVDDVYKVEFEEKIIKNPKLIYKGLFKSQEDSVYRKLQEYDLLLFPTKWKAEGVPGIIIESKIASLPAIVSDINFNPEIVSNGNDGIVIRQNSVNELYNAILLLYNDRELLLDMSKKARKSAEKYYIDSYIDELINLLE